MAPAEDDRAESPPAGWYPDPLDSGGIRYWDGRQWTEASSPQGTAGTAKAPAAPASPAGPGGTLAAPAQPAAGTPAAGAPATGAAPAAAPAPAALPLRGVARIASVALVAAIVVNLLYVAAMLDYADAIQTELNGSGISVEEAEEVEQTVSDTSLAYLAAMFAGAIGFLVWFQRAYRNCAHLTGRPLRYGVGWSIGAWFIPIFNLWRPKQIANDVWRGGDAAARNNPEWNSLRVSTAVHWWWLAWVLASVVAAVGSGLISPDTVLSDAATGLDVGDATLDQEHAAAVILAASGALSVIAGVMAIVFVRRASERQDARIAATAV